MKKYLVIVADMKRQSMQVVHSTDNIKVAQAWANEYTASYEHNDADGFASVIEVE